MKFNAVCFTILGIPGYFFFVGIGLVVSICAFIIMLYQKNYLLLKKHIQILFPTAVCVILCARSFGCISGIYRDIGMGNTISWEGICQTGIVFYGGLFGLLISYHIALKVTKQDLNLMNILAVCIPLFHFFARIGCFFGGCCFGKESKNCIAINYTTIIAGNVVTSYRVPIQLIESIFNLCLFLYLLHLYRKNDWKTKNILRKYLLIYSIGRFIIEFFRGDFIRGVICGVSFSQVISILIWIYLLATVRIEHNKIKILED